MNRSDVQLLAGCEQLVKTPMPPFSNEVCAFLGELSKEIRKNRLLAQYPDVITFGFYCRAANISRMKQDYESDANNKIRLGRGMVFHIAPSNVPINFAFSYVFGLLAGNSNVVRVSTKEFPQVDALCRVMDQLLEKPEHKEVFVRTQIVRYERNKEITDTFSKECQCRIIWGGDRTIEEIRKSPLPPRSTEITFADRYSFGMLLAEHILKLSEEELRQLGKDFYNDTYQMDQNACSSPHLILWKEEGLTKEQIKEAKERFWQSVYETAKASYDLAEIKVSEKYGMLCEAAIEREEISDIRKYENVLYVIELAKLQGFTDYRGKFGMFYEYTCNDLEEIAPFIDERVQTIAVAGIEKTGLAKQVADCKMTGIDRIVPFGKTLDIGLVWDGYDLIAALSRIIAIK